MALTQRLVFSGLLNAAYFLPLLWRGWFAAPADNWISNSKRGNGRPGLGETHWMLLWPMLFAAALSLLVGIFAASSISPLAWSQLIINREFGL